MFFEADGLSDDARSRLRIALNQTSRRKIDPEHALIALLADDQSPVVKACRILRPQMSHSSLRDAMTIRVTSDLGAPPATEWSDELLSERFRGIISQAQSDGAWGSADESLRNQLFCAAVVQGLKPGVHNTLKAAGIDAAELESRLRRPPVERDPDAHVFDEAGLINLKAFDRNAQKVLHLIEAEGRGLGLPRIVTSLVMFALVSHENGVLQTGLRLQVPAVDPKKLQEGLSMHVRSLGSGRFNENLRFHRDEMQPAVVQVLERAMQEADSLERPLVGEAEILKAFLLGSDTFVDACFRNEKVNVKELSSYVAQYQSGVTFEEDAEEEDELPSIEEVEQQLRQSVIGQDHAVRAVMPIIKRLRFGYMRKGRPACFCFSAEAGPERRNSPERLRGPFMVRKTN